jgi:hypothetical protein
MRMLLDGIAALKFISNLKFAHFSAVLHAHFYFYMHLGSLLKKRKQIKTFAKVRQVKNNDLSIVYQYFIKGIKTYQELRKIT